ncbi:hypothetical protein [Tateyamaria pelophila]|uniref:hypothetical protein n=1 Tax=Tateyamaria pelophila TaxID=328415 RepID=UPI001CBDBED0|nr:hypothetical protein [Tateyamaria pelophila]
MKKLISLLFLATASPVFASEPLVEYVAVTQTGSETYKFTVTIRHDDTGWDHYADGWRILDMDGTELGMRVLYHPHENEQPFTRSLDGVVIPAGTTQVQVQARDLPNGWNKGTTIVKLP